MKRLLTLAAICVAALGMACSSGDQGGTADQNDQAAGSEMAKAPAGGGAGSADHDDHTGHDHDDHAGHDHGDDGHDHPGSTAAGSAEKLPTGTEVTLAGTMGCGHCNFQVGSSCSAAMKTADGHIVIFDNVPSESEMFQKRMEGGPINVAGVISYDESGVAHMALKNPPM